MIAVIIVMAFSAVLYVAFAFAAPLLFDQVAKEDDKPRQDAEPSAKQPAPRAQAVSFGIAYGTEKKRWLTWAAAEFGREHPEIEVKLIPMGSIEGAQALLRENKDIHVWSPASPLYLDRFVQDWKLKHGRDPIEHDVRLALSPMVFVMWRERYDAFVAKYGQLDFKTISLAISENGGWDAIAQKPEWGLFKFGHTHPNQSNSGLMTLMLMAYHYHGKSKGLSNKEVLDAGFQKWLKEFESGVNWEQHSTGTLMEQMVLRGPSTFDCVSVYENVAGDYLENAAGRWGDIKVVYPSLNMWNDNPYLIIDAPWSSQEQRKAARIFAEFLMRENIQQVALDHGFRPGEARVSIKGPTSPFVRYEGYGLKIDIGTLCEPPLGATLSELLLSWQRTTGGR